jgi:membrane-bound metal-dependent hydrolase YbcI (DUF457 family)
MDILHHSMVGAVGAACALALGQVEAGAAFALASLAPDLDAVFMLAGKSRYLSLHRGPTHSLLFLPLIASIVVGATALLGDDAGLLLSPWCWIGALCGLLLHIAMDITNTFGVHLLWPFGGRTSGHSLFFIDLPSIGLTGVTLTAVICSNFPVTAVSLYLATFFLYAALKGWMVLRARRCLAADTVVPSGVFPTRAFFTRTVADGALQHGVCDLATLEICSTSVIPASVLAVAESARCASPTYRRLEKAFARFVPTKCMEAEDGSIIVTARCVAVRNFGNRYGEMVLRLRDGTLIEESARL